MHLTGRCLLRHIWSIATGTIFIDCWPIVRIICDEFTKAAERGGAVVEVGSGEDAVVSHGAAVADGPLLDHSAARWQVLQVGAVLSWDFT